MNMPMHTENFGEGRGQTGLFRSKTLDNKLKDANETAVCVWAKCQMVIICKLFLYEVKLKSLQNNVV
jgi:hypothetical protein